MLEPGFILNPHQGQIPGAQGTNNIIYQTGLCFNLSASRGYVYSNRCMSPGQTG